MIPDTSQYKSSRSNKLTNLQIFCGIVFFFTTVLCSMLWFDPPLPLVIPLYASLLYFMGLGKYLGYSFDEMQETISESIKESAPALLILMSVGALIGTWTMSGIVPTITYYGLDVISPSILLPSTVIVCGVASLIVGTSWGTVGTMGLALMGVAKSFGIPMPVMAGAILSGAYFGDKASPLSDSVILVTSVSKVKVLKHVKNLMPVSLPAILITIVMFYFIGLQYSSDSVYDINRIILVKSAIREAFVITPLSLLPILIVIGLLVMQVPAVITITIGSILGVLWGVWIQGKIWSYAILSIYQVPTLNTSTEMVNNLFSTGGINGMSGPILIIIFGISVAGVLQRIGLITKTCLFLENYLIRGKFSLVLMTIVTSIVINMLGSSMYMALIITPKVVYYFYRKYHLSPYLMSRSVEIGGTLTSCWIPWSDNGAFIASTLQVPNWEFIPYYILTYCCFLIALVYAYFGWFDSPYHHEKHEYSKHLSVPK